MARLRPARLRGDRGSLSVVAAAVAFPAVIALLAGFFQAALWFAARSTALAAAQQGADAARRTGATLAQGEAAACGTAPSFIAWFPIRACEQAQGARERFTTRTAP